MRVEGLPGANRDRSEKESRGVYMKESRRPGEKLEICDVRYTVGGADLLSGVDAAAGEGLVTAVVGPSGAGKSTLLRAINRLIEPSGGEVYLNGVPTGGMDPLELRRRVGMVFQLPALFGETVEEAILYRPRLVGREARATELLEVVGLERSLCSRRPETLSVGQQQRASVARALALEPEVLLMDEPTSALDEKARRRLEECIGELNRANALTIVLVSHDLGQVERLCDRVVLVVAGKSEGQWETGEFFSGEAGEAARRFVSGGL